MKSMIKKLLPLTLTLSLASGLAACTDDQIAAGVAGAAIGVGAAVIVAGSPGCYGGYHNVCSTYTDYNGYPQTQCRDVYDSCVNSYPEYHNSYPVYPGPNYHPYPGPHYNPYPGGHHGGHWKSNDLKSAQAATDAVVTDAAWAQAFGMSFDGAEKLVGALKTARDGSAQPLLDLGLSRKDLKKMAKYQLPSDKGLNALAQNIGLSREGTRAMVQQLVEKAAQ